MSIHEIREILRKDNHDCVTCEIPESLGKPTKEGVLSGYAITVKDCICVKDVESAAGSAILKDYKPPFEATAISKIREAGGTLVAKTAQDEFGFGSFSTNVGKGFKVPKNPLDSNRSCGGSSGGSGGVTALLRGKKHISIGESTGGSIASPAASCGVVGLAPTYGLVSRYGLIDYGNSLDKIGTLATTVKEAALGLSIIAGVDPKDSTSVKRPEKEYAQYMDACDQSIKGMKVGVITSFVEKSQPYVREHMKHLITILEKEGAKIVNICLPATELAGISAYYLIAMCEASTNLAKYCGIRYGQTLPLQGTFNEFFSNVRTEFFGEEAKRRMLIGTFARMAGLRDAYYLKALKVRAQIIAEYQEQFKECDVLLSPTLPQISPTFEEIEQLSPAQHYAIDLCVAPVNLAGLPHISVPYGKHENMPLGILVTANHFQEGKMITLAAAIERCI